jgi:hypothetical protein
MLSKYRKSVAAFVAALISVGGITVVLPGIDAGWAATITGIVTLLSVWLSPKNEDPEDLR